MFDVLIVGCGLSGSVIARHLAETKNLKVCIIDRRSHIAGNMYDFMDQNRFLIQKYGPHTFHTNKKELYDYMCRFGKWNQYKLTCMAEIDGKFTPTPFNFQTIDDFYPIEQAKEIKAALQTEHGANFAYIVDMLESANPLVRGYAEFLFEKDYSPYTAKQWGISPQKIDVSVLKRVPVALSYNVGYFDDLYQVMPQTSFTAFFENLLCHDNISVHLNTDAKELFCIKNNKIIMKNGSFSPNCTVVYTGAPDELLDYSYGTLPYRSLRFEYETIETDSFQDAPVVAYPQAPNYTRITEYTKIPLQETNGITVIAREYPLTYNPDQNTEPYYPILTKNNMAVYEQYKTRLASVQNLFLCGRLADYKYYNMDQALEHALDMCKKVESLW